MLDAEGEEAASESLQISHFEFQFCFKEHSLEDGR